MSSRGQTLKAIRVGDVIFGIAGGGQEKLMLVYKADETSIFARHVTSQAKVEFGRDGQSRRTPDGGSCTILSAEPLPPDQHQVVVGLDRKMRTAKQLTDLRLSEAVIQLLLTADKFFKAHPLPVD